MRLKSFALIQVERLPVVIVEASTATADERKARFALRDRRDLVGSDSVTGQPLSRRLTANY